jgi:hypothetical protein
MSTGPNEGFNSTYPDSWDNLPGTRTQKPGHEHANATEQEYYLQDETSPVEKGGHVRKPLRSAPTPPSDSAEYFPAAGG